MKKVFIIIALFAGLGLTYEFLSNARFYFTPNDGDQTSKILMIEPGSFTKTAEFLQAQGLLKDAKRFILLARILRKTSSVRVGEYEVRGNMSPAELLGVISSGKSVLHPVSIPEGFNIDQIAEELGDKNLVKKSEFLKLARDPRMAHLLGVDEKTLEGYLYPDTYSFTRFTGERVILKTMVDHFKEVYNREIKFGAEKQKMSMHEVVTLASVIEKETGAPQERPIISGVFHNRLKKGMPLQSDPTVIYGKIGDKTNITKADLHTYSPYNTYTIKALPVGPISNPGRDSMIAALEPTVSTYLFFVSKNNGTHYFSSTIQEHNKAVQRFQRDPKARANHSWRELTKELAAEKEKARIAEKEAAKAKKSL